MTDDRSARVNAVVDEMTHHLTTALGQLLELEDLDVEPSELVDLFKDRPTLPPDKLARLVSFLPTLVGTGSRTGMHAHIVQLFKDRGQRINDTDNAVIKDATVVLRTFPQVFTGALAWTKEGCLKLGSIGKVGGPNGPEVLVDQVFEVEDVLWIATTSEIKSAPVSRLFVPH